jgi:hypothetical protein
MCSWSSRLALKMKRAAPGGHRHQERHGAWVADCAVDRIRDRFGWDAVGIRRWRWGSPVPFPTSFRKLAEKDL